MLLENNFQLQQKIAWLDQEIIYLIQFYIQGKMFSKLLQLYVKVKINNIGTRYVFYSFNFPIVLGKKAEINWNFYLWLKFDNNSIPNVYLYI